MLIPVFIPDFFSQLTAAAGCVCFPKRFSVCFPSFFEICKVKVRFQRRKPFEWQDTEKNKGKQPDMKKDNDLKLICMTLGVHIRVPFLEF